MALSLEVLLRELISTPSVNPMGGRVDETICFEHRMTDLLESYFQRLDLPYLRQYVANRRENIVARLDGTISPLDGGKLLLWEVHQDTVPVDSMTIDPFGGELRGGKMYGRGACDVKGGMAAMLLAIARLKQQPPANMPTIVLACTVNEEWGFSGAFKLVESWQASGGDNFFPCRPDACLVAEPTELNVVVAHKGAIKWKIHTTGRAAHSSRPERGDNAIYKAARLLLALEKYQKEIVGTLAHDPLCGSPTMSVGTIHGGVGVNLVPESCVLEIDRRVVPGESPEKARQHLIDWLEGQANLDFPVLHDEPYSISEGMSQANNGALAANLAACAKPIAGGQLVGVPYGTDASVISATGVPTVVFGPGSIAQAHTADEWIELRQIEQAVEILVHFASEF